jgi:hypothetical protein
MAPIDERVAYGAAIALIVMIVLASTLGFVYVICCKPDPVEVIESPREIITNTEVTRIGRNGRRTRKRVYKKHLEVPLETIKES